MESIAVIRMYRQRSGLHLRFQGVNDNHTYRNIHSCVSLKERTGTSVFIVLYSKITNLVMIVKCRCRWENATDHVSRAFVSLSTRHDVTQHDQIDDEDEDDEDE